MKKFFFLVTKNNLVLSLLVITVCSLLSYAVLIPFLGFYADDYFFGYIGHFYGTEGIIKSLVVDRPFNGYLLALNFSILGDRVLLWHIYMFLVRLVGGYTLFFLLNKLWPKRLPIITSITLLFLIYPGFLQQPLPLGFENYISTLTLWIISLAVTVIATKNIRSFKNIIITLIAIFLQINSFLQLEFFIGMEVLRLLIITYILKGEVSFKSIKKSLLYFSPYIGSLIIFIIWRIVIFKSTRQETDLGWVTQTYYSNPIWVLKIPLEITYSFISATVLAYFIPILINFIRLPIQNSLVSLALGAISGLLIYSYYKRISWDGHKTKRLGKELFLVGFFSVLGALIPIIISGRFVRLYEVFDRYTISSIIGVSFLWIGFLSFKISRSLGNWILILLASLSITSHLMNGYWHKVVWDKQKDLWWQLYWRAPNIQKNAMLVLEFPPISEERFFKNIINRVNWYRFYWVDYQIWAEGNLFFNYNLSPQYHFRGAFLQDKGTIDKIRDKPIENVSDRNIEYTKDFNNSVIIITPGDQSCLWALDKERFELPNSSNELLKSSLLYSDVDRLTQSDISINPPSTIFGKEPTHNWCYYFQKASLARQFKKWDKLSQLTKEVLQKNLKPKDPNEWLPFIEGLIVSKAYSQADDLIKTASQHGKASSTLTTNICSMLKRLQTEKIEIYCRT